MKSSVRSSRLAAAIVSACLAGTTSALAAQPPAGVYACYEARYTQGAPGCVQSSLGCFGIQITPAPVMMFGLIDGKTYSDYDGHKGNYIYTPATNIIEMTDGFMKGVRYKHTADWSFVKLDDKGAVTSFTCPLDKAKNPLKRPW